MVGLIRIGSSHPSGRCCVYFKNTIFAPIASCSRFFPAIFSCFSTPVHRTCPQSHSPTPHRNGLACDKQTNTWNGYIGSKTNEFVFVLPNKCWTTWFIGKWTLNELRKDYGDGMSHNIFELSAVILAFFIFVSSSQWNCQTHTLYFAFDWTWRTYCYEFNIRHSASILENSMRELFTSPVDGSSSVVHRYDSERGRKMWLQKTHDHAIHNMNTRYAFYIMAFCVCFYRNFLIKFSRRLLLLLLLHACILIL